MPDFLTREQRSERMARIRGKDTRHEIALRKELHRLGLRYRLHVRSLPGTPDLVFPKYGAVVFVHGCFWHRHQGCKIASTPKSNTEFWIDKFSRNVERDKRVMKELSNHGWRVFTVWECQLGSVAKVSDIAGAVAADIRGRSVLSPKRVNRPGALPRR